MRYEDAATKSEKKNEEEDNFDEEAVWINNSAEFSKLSDSPIQPEYKENNEIILNLGKFG